MTRRQFLRSAGTVTISLATIGFPFKLARSKSKEIHLAVEFMNHAACAYISQKKGWFAKAGLNISTYNSYVTGMALASALVRGDINAAYICLVSAINTYANAGVSIRIVAGTHKYGYGLVVNPNKITKINDLENPQIRIGCVREGGTVDILLRRLINKYNLDEGRMLSKIRQMNPPMQVLAIKSGQIDAAFLPEHWATLTEIEEFKMLIGCQNLWPKMQGSVLAVREELIKKYPAWVGKLVTVTQKSTRWINQNPDEAAAITAQALQTTKEKVFPLKAAKAASQLKITPKIISRSMERLIYTTEIAPEVVQGIVNYMNKLGYIKTKPKVENLLNLEFLDGSDNQT